MSDVIDNQDIYAQLKEIFSELFARDDIALTSTTTAADIPEWDSFKQIEIIMAVELRFGIEIPTRELDNLKNVGDLVACISSVVKRKV